jgi:hypothetical protein
VFIDETAVTTKNTRLYGRAPLGELLVAKVPYGHWKTLTLVVALRVDSVTAPYVIDGAMDGRSFLAYVERLLVPTLRTLEAGRTQREGDCTLRDATSDNGSDRSLISFMGNLSVFARLLLGSYIISRFTELY